ncbi:hypothetical protein K435DRAFT_875250 [Dendrothele bispora CBS 962.96]|uniref:Uncharacterized protein n=1 Tax=Dendrothele bispora (strain CBS 962.96) TaxID=1314807 RepID=A0A4S8KV06_DENBC|nr:hypothetical protein K435DRAFT_875250 [Dendrothele bispora CBS 962.96]
MHPAQQRQLQSLAPVLSQEQFVQLGPGDHEFVANTVPLQTGFDASDIKGVKVVCIGSNTRGRGEVRACNVGQQVWSFWSSGCHPPDSPFYRNLNVETSDSLEEARKRMGLEQGYHRRNRFVAKGVEYLCHAPLFQFYYADVDALREADNSPRFDFPNSVFAAAVLDLDLRIVFFDHTDYQNFSAHGRYDYSYLTPVSMILIPSAYLRHSNTFINKTKTHYIFTQYMTAGLFHCVDDGHRVR